MLELFNADSPECTDEIPDVTADLVPDWYDTDTEIDLEE